MKATTLLLCELHCKQTYLVKWIRILRRPPEGFQRHSPLPRRGHRQGTGQYTSGEIVRALMNRGLVGVFTRVCHKSGDKRCFVGDGCLARWAPVIRQVGVPCMSVAGALHIFRGAPRGCREIRARRRDIVERRGHSTMAVLVSRRLFHVVFVCHDCLFRATATTPICNFMQHYTMHIGRA